MRIPLFILLTATLLTACKKDHAGCFDSAGEETTSTRPLAGFIGIDANDRFDVYITQDTLAPAVTITCGQNVLTGITTEIRDSVLYIRNENRCNFVRDLTQRIRVEVRVSRLSYIRMLEAAKIFSSGTIKTKEILIYQNSLEDLQLDLVSDFVDVRGGNSGAVTLTGKAQLVSASIEDVCVFNSRGMQVNDLYIYLYGRKNAFIDAKKIIGAYLFNSSNVYYLTDPSLDLIVERHSTGDLIKE